MNNQEQSAAKKYAAPTLTVHGTVTALTASGTKGTKESNKGQERGRIRP
ncbi:lasso RiPP family leader peptide-containing protein [Rubellimicrobium rubrum]|uniref:Lasso RiPP family leader peptide-containing protein n=1 Tax=Rubellimicrobium rubrum TaxID=2585369 RepID=A0A5C4MPM4_9RHOB|nr:lasso RiPP family leader peptide-containing protein [Rubellimicrobium rubrum]TNC46861.1 lasso RiPP family leader peptide-containing protein [Rubellimicrobium rubrum]